MAKAVPGDKLIDERLWDLVAELKWAQTSTKLNHPMRNSDAKLAKAIDLEASVLAAKARYWYIVRLNQGHNKSVPNKRKKARLFGRV